ncbi:DcaP family trimeric outer membrane transporter [Salinivirga cyanobacteriivorans]
MKGQKQDEWKNKLYGFVRADAFYDSRQSAEAVDGLFLLYPLNSRYDDNGKDLNEVNQITMTSISSRLGLNMGGKSIFNKTATIGARLEADFTARSNANSLRLRHAYVSLNWQKHAILMGRTWHPMFTPKVFPLTLSINVGTPFNPFNRSPQIRYTYKPSSKYSILFAVLYQNDYNNLGPDGNGGVEKRIDLMRNSMIPNLHWQAQLGGEKLKIGIMADYKQIQPRTETTGTEGTFKTEVQIPAYATGLFAKTTLNKLSLKTKILWGQNLSDHVMLGGYGVKKHDTETGHETYTPSNHIFSWLNLEYGHEFTAGLLLGYSKNLGFSDNLSPDEPVYARGSDIAYLYRISPYLKWRKKELELWAETEITTAAYGDIQYANKGKIQNSREVTNVRLQISCIYYIL